MASISADCPHTAPVSLHCPVRMMVIVLTCPEVHALHFPMICLFCPGSAFDGSAIEFVPVCPVFFHVLPCIFLPFLSLHAMFQVAGTGSRSASAKKAFYSLLVCHLNHSFSILGLNTLSIHERKDTSALFSAAAKNHYVWSSPEDFITFIKLYVSYY